MIKEKIYEYYDNERIRKENQEKDYDKKFNIAPSYLNSCIRKIYYKKNNTKSSNPISLHNYIKFEMGHAVHEKLAEIMSKMFYIRKGEIWHEKDMHGVKWVYRVDDYLMLNAYEYIIEIKSIYGNLAYNDMPKEDAIMQLFCYMLLENIDRGILLYICRDTGFIEEFHFNIEGLKEKYGEKYKERLGKLKELRDSNELPDREYNIVIKKNGNEFKYDFQKDNVKYKSCYQCSYCQYQDLCWQDVLKEMVNYNFYIQGEFIK